MEFEELKVEIPADDSDQEEKDLPFNFVSKMKIYLAIRARHLLKHSNIFSLILPSQERRYENKSGCFVTGFDVTSKVLPMILLTFLFVLVR